MFQCNSCIASAIDDRRLACYTVATRIKVHRLTSDLEKGGATCRMRILQNGKRSWGPRRCRRIIEAVSEMITQERSEAGAFLPLMKRELMHTVWPYSILPTCLIATSYQTGRQIPSSILVALLGPYTKPQRPQLVKIIQFHQSPIESKVSTCHAECIIPE